MVETGPRVLVVDDEPAIRRFLHASLEAHGYVIHAAATGEEALQLAPTIRPDVVIVDLGLPGISGLDVIRSLREWSKAPAIVLSVREDEADKISALDAGADDYLTKPFGVGELLARIRATLRRASARESGPLFTSGELSVDLVRREVKTGARKIQLTPTEYDLLRTLVLNAGKVMTHRQLLHLVWGGLSFEDGLHLLRVHVSNLRHKLESDPTRPRHILTEPGVGYRLSAESRELRTGS